MDNPGKIHLVCVGPLTNAALACLQEPRLAENLASLVIMGGAFQRSADVYADYGEHNIISDAEAAHIVFTSGAPITLVPLDVTMQVRITQAGSARIRAAGTAFHAAVADQIDVYPPFADRGWTHMHDPLAVAALVEPGLVRAGVSACGRRNRRALCGGRDLHAQPGCRLAGKCAGGAGGRCRPL